MATNDLRQEKERELGHFMNNNEFITSGSKPLSVKFCTLKYYRRSVHQYFLLLPLLLFAECSMLLLLHGS